MLLIDLERCLLKLAVVLSPIEDSTLQATPLRFFGASPSALIVLLALASHALRVLLGGGEHSMTVNNKVVCYAICSALGSTALFLMLTENLDVVSKTFKYALVIGVYAYFVFRLAADFAPYRKPVYLAVALAIVGFFAGDLFGVLPQVFHFTENGNMRNRGVALESSTFGTQMGIYALLCASLVKSRPIAVAAFLVCLGVLVASASKGAMLSMLIALLAVYWLRSKRLWLAVPLAAALVLGLAYVLPLNAIVGEFDFSTGTGLATRLTMMLIAMKIACTTVIGAGPGGASFAVQMLGPGVLSFVEAHLPVPLLFGEVEAYVRGDPDAIVTFKTFFADNMAIFGLPFVWFFFARISPVALDVARRQVLPISVLAVFLWTALVFYHGGYGYYSVGLGIAYIMSIAKNEKKNTMGHA